MPGVGVSRGCDPQFATNGGAFDVIGTGSQTALKGRSVKLGAVTGDLSNTALFGWAEPSRSEQRRDGNRHLAEHDR